MHEASLSPSDLSASAPSTRIIRREIQFLILIILLAATVRLYAAAHLACISRDGVHFITYAKQLVDDPIPTLRTTTKQPGYAYMLIATHRVLGNLFGGDTPLAWQRCGQLLATLGGIASTVLIYFLTRRLFDVRIARTAAIFACFWPHGVSLSADVLSDMPHLALFLGALLLAYSGILKPQIRMFVLCGILAGMAYLLRQEALGLAIAVSVCLLWPQRNHPLRRRAINALILWACFAVIVAPYAIAAGRIMPNKSIHDLLFGNAAPLRLLARDCLAGVHTIAPWKAPLHMFDAWGQSGRYVISTLVILYLLFFRQVRAERQGQRLLLLAALLQLIAVQLRVKTFGEISSRYLAIPLVLSIPYAAAGFNAIIDAILRRRASHSANPAALIWTVGMLIALSPMLYYIARPTNYAHAPLRTAGLWLAEHTKPDEKILASDELDPLMFYAGRTYPDTTWIKHAAEADFPRIRAYLRRRSPSWFIALAHPSLDGKTIEPAYVFSALNGEIPQLEPVSSVGSAPEITYIFRVVTTTTPRR